MADKITRKSSIRTRNGSKDSTLESEEAATTSKLLEKTGNSSNTSGSGNSKISKKRKSSSSNKRETTSIELTKRLANSSKHSPVNSSNTSPITSTKQDNNKTKKKQKLNNSYTESSEATTSATASDYSRNAKAKAIVKLSKNKHSTHQVTIDSDQEDSTKKSTLSGSRRRSNDSAQSTGRKLRSNISEEQSNGEGEQEQEQDTKFEYEEELEHSYLSRLRRQSNSSSRSTSKLSEKESEVPSKKQKLTGTSHPSTSKLTDTLESKKSKRSFWSKSKSQTASVDKLDTDSQIAYKQASNRKETGGCISKPGETSHLTSASRKSHQNQHQTSTHQHEATSGETSQALTSQAASYEPSSLKHSVSSMSGQQNSKSVKNSDNSTKTSTAIVAEKSANAMAESGADSSDNDTSAEFSRLSDILQSRGLPSHIVNAFGSKVQQFLHRTMSSGINGRSQSLINSLQQPDDSLKLTALAEICQLLVMGNEDTLVGFPIKQAVPLLLQCMNSESENFDLMNHACRALTYMMESLPRSSGIIAEGIGIFLEKLQVIQCMDVAEQALTALEILSRRHSKQILNATQAGSISACLTYIDFFSITAQRNALQITSRCCQNMIKNEFVNIQPSLPILSQRLTHTDKKSVESVCNIFARLVENFQKDALILKEIASHNVLINLQQLLVVQPSVVSSSMFVTILHTIYLMCANCTELASELLENNISNTFVTLLIGNSSLNESISKADVSMPESGVKTDIEILSARSPQELYEIVAIIGEIMPSLPKTGIFSIDEILRKTSAANHNEDIVWQWKDERDVWRPYTPNDSRMIESAYSHAENECILNTSSRSYVLDFSSMMQINEETGTARPIARKLANTDTTEQQSSTPTRSDTEDSRLAFLKKNPKVYTDFISSLFGILYAVYSSSAGPSIKNQCLRSLLRMIYYSPNENDTNNNSEKTEETEHILYGLMKNLPISSQIASMLASSDTKILVSALQMCDILMQKIPKVFSMYFHREGVIHQIGKLIDESANSLAAATTSTSVVMVEEEETKTELDTDTKFLRKTRSSTSTEQATTSSGDIQSKRKTRLSQSSKCSNSPSHSSFPTTTTTTFSSRTTNSKSKSDDTKQDTLTKPDTPTADSSTSSVAASTAKYFRNMITKIHGHSISSSAATSSSQNSQESTNKPSEFLFSNEPAWSHLKTTNNTGHSNQSSSSNHVASVAAASNGQFFEKLTANQFLAEEFTRGDKASATSATDAQSLQQKNSIDYNAINVNKEKVRQWIYEQAKKFRDTYFPVLSPASPQQKEALAATPGLNVLSRLKSVMQNLELTELKELDESLAVASNPSSLGIQAKMDKINENYMNSLVEISNILNETDISSFEMIHSGLIERLVSFLSIRDLHIPNLERKLNQTSMNYSSFSSIDHCNPSYIVDLNELIKNELRSLHCKQFLKMFSNLPLTYYCQDLANREAKNEMNFFSSLIGKLHNCVNQLEQFAVRVHDVPSSAGGEGGSKNAIKFFNTHQLKCLLRRHPSCATSGGTSSTVLSQWKGGPVKVDPLAAISTVEKYLICRGIHRIAPSSSSSNNALLSSTFPSTATQKSFGSRFSKSASKSRVQSAVAKSKHSSKPPSSRLFILKAAAEMATDRFKMRKSRNQNLKTIKSVEMLPAASKTANLDTSVASPKADKQSKKSKKLDRIMAKSSKQAEACEKKSNKKSKSSKKSTGKSQSRTVKSSDTMVKSNESASYIVDEEDEEGLNVAEESIDNDEYEFNEDVEIQDRIDEMIGEDEGDEVDYDDHDFDEDEIDEEDDIDEEDIEDEIDEDDSFDHDQIGEEINESDDDEDKDFNEEDEDEEEDDGDIEFPMSAILGSLRGQGTTGGSNLKNFYLSSLIGNSNEPVPKIELLINDRVLPSTMSVYQAIRMHSNELGNKDSENELENTFINNAIWSKVHLVHYRLAQPVSGTKTSAADGAKSTDLSSTDSKRITRASQSSLHSVTASPGNSKTTTKSTPKAKSSKTDQEVAQHDEDHMSNIYSSIASTVFFNNLTNKWVGENLLSIKDQALDSISLLRLLNTLNRDWYLMYSEVYGQNYFNTGLGLEENSQAPSFLVSSEQFVNTKLTAKANRQLQDPLVIMTGHLPKWLPELMQTCPFLFPFKTRFMYFYVSSLDRDRAMQKLIDINADMLTSQTEAGSDRQNDRFTPKLEKKKRTINRHTDLIKQTDSILNEFCSNANNAKSSSQGTISMYSHQKPALLEIQYEGEVGTGLGPTLEFYAIVSQEVQKCEYEMWRGEKIKLETVSGPNQNQFFYFSSTGLFPAPISTLHKQSSKQQANINKIKSKFKFLGKFMAKAVMDFRVLDIHFSYTFYKWLISPNSLCEQDIKYVDAQLNKSIESLRDYLRKRRQLLIRYNLIESGKINTDTGDALKAIETDLKELEKTVEAIDLDFTMPGYGFDLKKNGKDMTVTLDNLEEYLKLIVDWTLVSGVQQQLDAFKEGFESLLPLTCLRQFYPEELERLFCGSGYHEWTLKILNECTRCDHGFTHESKAVKHLFDIMCSFDHSEQRQFLQFITGSPRLPVGGLQSLVPPLTIVRKTTESSENQSNNADSYLPSVMTCVNYLKLPDYSSMEGMKEKLVKAMKDGQMSFHLS